jgi:AhpD family alkylhydroperoxidase
MSLVRRGAVSWGGEPTAAPVRFHNLAGMTSTDTGDALVSIPVRLDFDALAPEFSRAMAHLDRASRRELDRAAIDQRLRELIRIRVSQINGCAYCIDMHTKDARAVGESEQRIYALPAWREAPFFTERERAAFELADAMALMAKDHVPDEIVERAKAVFGDEEIAALVTLIVSINAWNAIGVSTRAWEPGSYERDAAS